MLLSDEQLKDILLQKNLVNEKVLHDVIDYAKNTGATLNDAIIEQDILSDEILGQVIADVLQVPFIVLSKMSIPEPIMQIVPERIARKYNIVAFEKTAEGTKLAMSDPTNTILRDMITKKTNQPTFPFFATARDISNTLQIYQKDLQKSVDELLQRELSSVDSVAPIIKIVDQLITYAYNDKASDIHIEPQEESTLVRFRIDGVLHDVLYQDKKYHDRIVTRIKVLSRLRTDEHLSPQDGKMRMQMVEENLDLRVSIIPIADGEKVVMRLLSSRFRQISLHDIGMSEKDINKVNTVLNKSYGMILSTGPTGSGKTTTIYSLLKLLNTREKNITTIEDPIEYRIKGINQIQVNQKTNLTFANGLRSVLRQDPNIIFVGEIRDSETASIAVNASLTGHLVVSTVHTNDAATVLPRLVDMKVEPFLVASTVDLIIAQRLVREICSSCKIATTMKVSELNKNLPQELITTHFGTDEEIQIYHGQGCKLCHFTGYIGRLGVFEVIEVTARIKKLLSEKNDADVLLKEAKAEGMSTMLEDGLDKVKKGVTTIDEVLRVTKVEVI